MQRIPREVTEKFKLQSTSKQNTGLSVFFLYCNLPCINEGKGLKETPDLMLMSPAFFGYSRCSLLYNTVCFSLSF